MEKRPTDIKITDAYLSKFYGLFCLTPGYWKYYRFCPMAWSLKLLLTRN